jgi:hypothetical protein
MLRARLLVVLTLALASVVSIAAPAVAADPVTAAANQPPMVSAGGPYQVAEGDNVVLRATGTDPEGRALTYTWDLDGDGMFETAGSSVRFSAAGLDGPSTRTVTVKASNPSGANATAQTTVSVRNARPSASFAVSATLSTRALRPSPFR